MCIAISIISSLKDQTPLPDCTFIGELGLNGQVRKSKNIELKVEEGIRLGYKKILIPKSSNNLLEKFSSLIEIIEVKNIKDALNIALNY